MAARCEAAKQLLGVVDLIVVVDRIVVLVGVKNYYRLTLICPHESDILTDPIGYVRTVQLGAQAGDTTIPFCIASSFAVFICKIFKRTAPFLLIW